MTTAMYYDAPSAVDILDTLFSYFNKPNLGKAQTYRVIVDKLNDLHGSTKHWTWNYLHMVHNRKMEASPILITQLLRLFETLCNPQIKNFELVQVIAPVGTVAPESILTIPTRACGFCHRLYIPKVHNQIYCSIECRRGKRNAKK